MSVPNGMLYAVAYEPANPHEDGDVWTVSFDPAQCGWETDCGYSGYGLQKDVAEEICRRWNEKEG